ncbi:ABC transporter permease [Clostridiisalibacter paucivorans]|uniref:ABC transporter permease n=1 Tax=Clostridiisalibacter paucivorans TaxID=408753 RepID=UPI000478A42E|nr:ABC transporter permease [Clostridiisalibacter paucivorans]
MAEIKEIPKDLWQRVPKEEKEKEKIVRPSLTYWQDAWRRLKKNKLAMIGLIAVIIILMMAVFGPMFSKYGYEEQRLDMANIPHRFQIYKISEDKFVYIHNEYMLYEVSGNGELIAKLDPEEDNMAKLYRTYNIDGKEVVLDYSLARERLKNPEITKDYELKVDGNVVEPAKKVFNKTYWLGSDSHGRDLFVRVLYGARISLAVAVVATLVNFFIGVFYGGISGYFGGRVDNIMMRIVDIINTVPLILYVILLMVVIGPGLKTIILTMGLVYWVRMARIVRGQVLSLKGQEFVLAARTLGASTWRILTRHLIPNTLGPVVVSLTMMIPNAIFTESFLSFIGLGVSAPMASWGTLASDALGGLRSYAYQLLAPSIAICITMLAFNFLGDGLRDALDPRLRK